MSDQLVIVENKNVMQVFTSEKGLDPYVEMIRLEVENHVPDLETDKGRKAIASLARKVASSKVYLDELGKDLVSGWKKQAKVVDSARKAMRDELDELKVKAREPLTKWEEEKAEKERIFQEKAAALKLAEQVENDHEIALLMNEKFDRELADKLEAERITEEKRQAEIKRQQEEREKEIAAKAKADAEKAQKEAEERAAQAEKDKIAAQEKAERDAREAEERAIKAEKEAKERAEKAAEEAKQAEIRRQKEEEERKAEEQRKIEANKKHIGSVRREIKEQLMSECKLDEPTAKKVVLAMVKMDRVTINY